MTLRRSDFHFDLPPELIAQQPLAERAASRLLCVDADALHDRGIRDLPALLRAGDLLVFNDTRVIAARLFGEKESGGKVEVMIERVLGDAEALAQMRASKAPKAGARIRIEGSPASLRVLGREGEFFRVRVEGAAHLLDVLESAGHMPLPPYIKRADAPSDRERYQTVFAREPGAVAAPTAGLHFDAALLDAIRARGVESATVTLHVGAGTFQPLRVENLADHRMHRERVSVTAALCEQVRRARERGGRVIAVGTTVVRSLESAAARGGNPGRATSQRSATSEAGVADSVIEPFDGETDIFITPGFRFRVVDALLTNFHLPESTLLMLVSAFAGRERVLAAYAHAVRERYRFFSYGDAMFIPHRIAA